MDDALGRRSQSTGLLNHASELVVPDHRLRKIRVEQPVGVFEVTDEQPNDWPAIGVASLRSVRPPKGGLDGPVPR